MSTSRVRHALLAATCSSMGITWLADVLELSGGIYRMPEITFYGIDLLNRPGDRVGRSSAAATRAR